MVKGTIARKLAPRVELKGPRELNTTKEIYVLIIGETRHELSLIEASDLHFQLEAYFGEHLNE